MQFLLQKTTAKKKNQPLSRLVPSKTMKHTARVNGPSTLCDLTGEVSRSDRRWDGVWHNIHPFEKVLPHGNLCLALNEYH